MGKQFQFTVDHMIGRREIELVVTYSWAPGMPETGPSYSCGGTPAEPPEVGILSVTHDGQPFKLTDELEQALIEEACECGLEQWADEQASAADYLYEQRRDDAMLERWERGQ